MLKIGISWNRYLSSHNIPQRNQYRRICNDNRGFAAMTNIIYQYWLQALT